MVLFLPFAFNFYYSTIKIQNYNFVKLLCQLISAGGFTKWI